MPSKLQLYAQLADRTAVEAAGSYQKWTALLQTMARLYKYPYHEQLMIFAQRPDATACADYDIWNKQMRRYIKRGSSGIALIDTSGDNPALKYVFDVSDTGGRENSRRPYLFQYREEHEQAVTAALEEKFGETHSAGFSDFLEDIAANLVGDYWTEHYQDICDNIDGSFLEGYDVDNLKHTFLSAATVSSAYVVMARCGLDPEERFEHLDFMPVFDFNTPPVISALGTAVSQSSETVLRQIEITVKKYEREKITERSQNHEQLNLSQEWRLSDSRPKPVRPAEAAPGQVREDAEEIPSGTPSGTVEHHDPVRDAVPPSEGDRPDGEQQTGAVDASTDEVSRRDGGAESPRPDEMGGPDEQPESPGRGNHPDRAGVQLTGQPPVTGEQFSFFPSEGEQIQYIAEAERAEKAPSAFSIPQETIDTFLRIGSNTEDHRMRVVNEFAKQKPMAELTAFLSKTYHGGYGIELNGAKITAWYGEDGMRFAYGNTARYSKNAQLLSWEDAAKRIGALLEQGQFATNVELAEAFSFERLQVASQLWYMKHDMSKEAREAGYMSIISALGPDFQKGTEKLCVYLSEPESYQALMKELHTFLDAYQKNSSLMRFPFYKPDKLLAPMEDLTVPRLEYTSSISEMPAVKSFITEDEINERLSGGSNFAGSKARIYDFYQTPHTAKEKQNFLKNEYGTGGGNCALSHNFHSDEWHDSKGIRFDKPNCTRIELSWAKVAKYVDALMEAGRYFTPEQLAQRQTSEEELLGDAAEPEAPASEVVNTAPENVAQSIASVGPFYADYREVKKEHPDYFVLVKLNDGYFAFEKDALEIAAQLNLDTVKREIIGRKRPIDVCFLPKADFKDHSAALANSGAGLVLVDHDPDKGLETFLIRSTKDAELYRGSFEYNGYHFAAVGKFPKGYNLEEAMNSQISSDREMGLSNYDWAKHTYSHSAFYNASGDSQADIFRCIENGKLYLPGDNELFCYTGEYQELAQQISQAVPDTLWDYNDIKEAHPDDLVLYQVGDFFEIYGEDAKQAAPVLNLTLMSRPIPTGGRVEMCGIPAHTLEQNVEKLRDSFDVTIAAINEQTGTRNVYTLVSIDHEAERAINAHEAEYGADGFRVFRDQEALNALPTLQEQLDQYKPRIAAAISEDTAYRNACGHSDHENAVIEGNAAVRRAVLNSGDMELIRLYSDGPDFRHRLHQEAIDETYPKLHELLRPLSQDDIDEALIRWNEDMDSKRAVVRYMNSHARDRATAAWLSHEYSGSDTDGLFIVRTGSPEETKLPWPNVQRRIAQLIKEGRFFTEEEQDRFEDVDPIAVREALAERGIVNGELVDPDALGRDPFIQQVTADVERIATQETPSEETVPTAKEEMTTLQKKAIEIAKRYENLSMQEKINIIAQAFGCTSGKIETSPCTGKWRGTSDISIRFDNGTSYFLGNTRTPQAKTAKVQNERVTAAVRRYNPEIVQATKEAALPALIKREEKDNAIAAQKGLKPYTVLNVELNNGADDKSGGYIGWYYVTLAVGGKIVTHLETGLNYDISNGKVRESPTRERYYAAGALKEADVDYIFDNVGFSSSSDLYSLTLRDDVRERAEKALAERTTSNRFVPEVGRDSTNTEFPAENFRITDDNLGVGGAKAKFRMNMDAITLLHELEQDGRQATAEEQEVLSRYVGWGGVPDAFDPNKPNWSVEYQELKELLTPEEYKAARASTLNAHYTSPTVIRAIYEAIGNMGFQTGNILEPAMGVGNFFGMLPEEMQNSRLYGVELDSITGRIAKQLYPKANITVAGFETTDRRDFYDLAVGNVPFGQYQVNDRAYNKLGFSIHNYFFAKALDQVRPGGIVAFVTSRYTMDAKNPEVRKYLAQRAELLGAIRLPNNAFRANAGTDVVSDIIFLQKRDRPIDRDYDWVHLGQTEDGYAINSYFLEHPEMVMGRNGAESTAHGMDYTVEPLPDVSLASQLKEAVQHIHGTYRETELPDLGEGESIQDTLPADPNVKNYSYTLVDGEIYYRENSIMVRPDLNATAKERIKGMLSLSTCVHELIDLQMEESIPDSAIKAKQTELNQLYDSFVEKYGIINNRGNKLAFSDDSAYYLLCALEVMDDDGKFKRKADMFFKRTIQPHHAVSSVDTAIEALTLSIAEKAKVDMAYMSRLSGKTEEVLAKELRGVIFRLPEPVAADGRPKYVTADEYLSGNVRKKLEKARLAARDFPELFSANVEALEAAQPKDLDASEIEVRLGATWIDKSYIQQFMNETFDTPYRLKNTIQVQYSPSTAAWFISNKSKVSYDDITAYQTYGTDRASAYDILEDSLNLRDVRIYDTVRDPDGNEKRMLNAEETTLAAQKQQAIREAFKDWIWADPERRQKLVRQYNEEMNSTRPREYDGSHISFVGMNPEITLREHQRNAIAHVLYGGNTLLAHEVGAGKTFEMVAAAMESKRLGLCQKSIFVVPNHLTEQWASEFLRLYPSANILVTRQRDFETANRKKFCARIATGDYDAVIIGHSQFEKIPISKERQERLLQDQIDEITMGIEEVELAGGERFTVKQLERTKRGLEARLEKLAADHRKDDVVTFEQLGVDRMFVDEAHSFKNLFLYTKMQNVAGLSTSDAQKSSDMFAKCRYMDEITGSRGVVFATGTPVSNSMTELYTMQRYLQYERLEEMGMTHFDCWASRFGETVTALELAPEGKGYRPRTRFSRFFNLPELMQFFKEAADIKTADQLHLPTPEVEYHNVVAKPTEVQKDLVQQLSERAADVHAGIVDSSVDNMLKITSDGRKLGLDQRIINPAYPDEPGSKVNLCVDNIMKVWEDGKADKLTQLVFCDISTPQAAPSRRAAKEMPGNLEDTSLPPAAGFTVYEDIRKKLIFRGVPPEEIAFIHDANTDARKKELFGKVRSGQVRVLLGSTSKMGAGTNVQDRLVAIHDLDCPWRPGDLAQRKGRIERQGNKNEKVHVFRYVTEGTFDAYLWQTVENKQKFISQIMSSKSPVRSCDDVDETALSFAEIKALCAGDPRIKERMDLDVEVSRLKLMKASHKSNQYRLEDNLLRHYPEQIEKIKGFIQALQEDMETLSAHPHPPDGFAGMTVLTDDLTDKDNAGAALIEATKKATGLNPVEIGAYRGFKMSVTLEDFGKKYVLTMRGKMTHQATLGSDARGNLIRLDNALAQMPQRLTALQTKLDELYQQRDAAKAELGKPFPYEEELRDKSARLIFLDAELNMDGKKEPSQEQVVAKSSRPSVLAKLRNPTPQPRTERKIKHHEEVR